MGRGDRGLVGDRGGLRRAPGGAVGWHLVVVARRRDRLEALAHRLHGAHEVDVRPLPADLGRAEDVGRLCTEIDRTAPDMLVNNAGLAHYAPFAELDPGRAEELVALNAAAPVLLIRAAVPGMLARGRGSVVNVASLLAFSGAADLPYLPARAVYAATKAFLVTFTEVLAAELRGTGVRVQVICPGVVRSEFHSRQGMGRAACRVWQPDRVVDASLADLDHGVVVSIPGASSTEAYAGLVAAEAAVLAASRATEPAPRHHST